MFKKGPVLFTLALLCSVTMAHDAGGTGSHWAPLFGQSWDVHDSEIADGDGPLYGLEFEFRPESCWGVFWRVESLAVDTETETTERTSVEVEQENDGRGHGHEKCKGKGHPECDDDGGGGTSSHTSTTVVTHEDESRPWSFVFGSRRYAIAEGPVRPWAEAAVGVVVDDEAAGSLSGAVGLDLGDPDALMNGRFTVGRLWSVDEDAEHWRAGAAIVFGIGR